MFAIPCWANELSTEAKAHLMYQAHEAIAPIKKNFKDALTQALGKAGAAKAIDKCKVDSAKLTSGPSVSGIETIEVGRTSLKLRNPKNAPRDWMKPHLNKFKDWKPGDSIEKRLLINLGPHRYGYLEPIYVQGICLSCHGKFVTTDIKKEIAEHYPQDEAMGYEFGALRGFFWAELSPRTSNEPTNKSKSPNESH